MYKCLSIVLLVMALSVTTYEFKFPFDIFRLSYTDNMNGNTGNQNDFDDEKIFGIRKTTYWEINVNKTS